MLLYIYKYIIFILYIKIYKIDSIYDNIMELNKSVEKLINIKLNSIIKDLNNKTDININEISNFISNKYNFINIDKINNNANDLIKEKLLDYLNNDPKFLYFNKTLLDIVKNLKSYAEKKRLDDSYITEDYVNDILISFLNHNI